MSRATGSQRAERRREQAKNRKKKAASRVVRRGQRATLNGKPVIADGKGNWMPASHYDRYSKNYRKGKPAGTYTVGKDRSKKPTNGSWNTTKYWTTKDGRKVYSVSGSTYDRETGKTVYGSANNSYVQPRGFSVNKHGQATRHQRKKSKDELRMERAIKQGGGRTGEGYVGTGQPTTKPKSAGTKPAQTKKPKSKPAKDNRPTTVKEIAGAEAFIAAHENKKGAMQNAVRQARARLKRLKEKRAEEVRGNRPRNA